MVADNAIFHGAEDDVIYDINSGYIALIDRRTLERECLAHSLNYHLTRHKVLTFSDIDHWQEAKAILGNPSAVLFSLSSATGHETAPDIANLVAVVSPAAVIILSDSQDINAVLDGISVGVCGYIPSSVSVDICMQAIGLAIAGGRFIPASSILGVRDTLGLATTKISPPVKFTDRQLAIAEAIHCGKANKDIASELNLRESTIKVHIRNVMRKLGASNRTEVASKISEMFHPR